MKNWKRCLIVPAVWLALTAAMWFAPKQEMSISERRKLQQMPALTGSRNVYGSYVHGIFDAPGITDTILKALCARKGVSFDALATFDACGYKERQYDLLADVVRGGLDMSFVYRVLRREV